MNEVTFSITELAEYLGITEKSIETLINSYAMPVYKNKGELSFSKNKIDKYIYDNQIYRFVETEKEFIVCSYNSDYY